MADRILSVDLDTICLRLVLDGVRTLESVPERWRTEVADMLAA